MPFLGKLQKILPCKQQQLSRHTKNIVINLRRYQINKLQTLTYNNFFF